MPYRTPAIPDYGTASVQVAASDEEGGFKGHRPIRVYGFDDEGYPLVLAKKGSPEEGRLIRAQERPDFVSIGSRKHASEREQDIPAAAGWSVQIINLGEHWANKKMDWNVQVGDTYPVMMWRYLGPADVRPVIPRPTHNQNGELLNQRGYDPVEMKMSIRLYGPGEDIPSNIM